MACFTAGGRACLNNQVAGSGGSEGPASTRERDQSFQGDQSCSAALPSKVIKLLERRRRRGYYIREGGFCLFPIQTSRHVSLAEGHDK